MNRRAKRRLMRRPGIAVGGMLGVLLFCVGLYILGGNSTHVSTNPGQPNQELYGAEWTRVPVATTPNPAASTSQEMLVRGVSPENAAKFPQLFYSDGNLTGAKVFLDAALIQEVKKGDNWVVLSNGDEVKVLQNVDEQTVRIQIISHNGPRPVGSVNTDDIGVVGYVRGWIITGDLPSQ